MKKIYLWAKKHDKKWFIIFNQKMKCRFLDITLSKITHLGGALITISTLILLIIFNNGQARIWSIMALLSLGLSHLAVHIIKKSYKRLRPYNKLEIVNLITNPLRDYSFPSGHTTAVFSIATVFAFYSTILAVLLIPLASIVAISRMYLGLHYPIDCVTGAMLGISSSIIIVQAIA